VIQNLAFYRFFEVDAPADLRDTFRRVCEAAGLRGTVLVATEGINAMLAGEADGVSALVEWLRSDERFSDMPVKVSPSEEIPFGKLVVKVKPEIVTMRTPGVSATTKTAPHLPPEQLRDWLRDGEELVLIDTRNDYEYALGTFRGAIDPETASFHEFPDWVRRHRDDLRDRRVVMFCTGGIRCEKATSWMLDEGFDDVWQLDGGVLNYFERIEDADRDWSGELFVFDDRVAVDTHLRETDATLCEECGAPVCDHR
jgi:UPF0176 protein